MQHNVPIAHPSFPTEESVAVEFAVSLDAPEALACDALGVGIAADSPALDGAAARVEGAILGAYRFLRYKRDEVGHVAHVTLLAADPAQQKLMEAGVSRGRLFADATVFARDLVNEPPNHLPPVRLAEIATETARK